MSQSWRFAAWFRADTPDSPTYSHQSDVSYFCKCLQFRYGKKKRISHLYLPPSGSSWWRLMHKGQEVIVTLKLVKIQNQASISGQNPAGFIQRGSQNSVRQRPSVNCCVIIVVFVFHHTLQWSAICTRISTEIRGTRTLRFRHVTRTWNAAAPAIQSERVFMDIRRSATACQACDKSRIIWWETRSRNVKNNSRNIRSSSRRYIGF